MEIRSGEDQRVKIPEHVGFTIVSGEAVILDMKRGLYFGLDEIGTAIWQRIAAGDHPADIVSALEREYDVDPRQLHDDVRAWLGRAREAGLIEQA